MTTTELEERPCTRCKQQFQPRREEQWLCDGCREDLKALGEHHAHLNATLNDRLRARRRS